MNIKTFEAIIDNLVYQTRPAIDEGHVLILRNKTLIIIKLSYLQATDVFIGILTINDINRGLDTRRWNKLFGNFHKFHRKGLI